MRNQKNPAPDQAGPFITVQAARERAGYSKRWIRDRITSGELDSIGAGAGLRVCSRSLDRMIGRMLRRGKRPAAVAEQPLVSADECTHSRVLWRVVGTHITAGIVVQQCFCGDCGAPVGDNFRGQA